MLPAAPKSSLRPKGSQRLPEAPRSSHKLPKAPRIPEFPRSSQKFPEAPKGSQTLPEAPRNSQMPMGSQSQHIRVPQWSPIRFQKYPLVYIKSKEIKKKQKILFMKAPLDRGVGG